eukprot:TRINITY_DN2536_c0_g1_i10.p3 TRINITY_DN2536_c0_g1~~TRINITY_DN2536_c0_g1_i10.p3  ORF type:complete len:166 (-),score=31.76 TRINITY_DN2536_c0_g1_i10:515-1012(-)
MATKSNNQQQFQQPYLFLIPVCGDLIVDSVFKTKKKSIFIGSSPKANLILPHPNINFLHANIYFDEEDKAYQFKDLGSKQGTYVQLNEQTELEIDDLIEFGTTLFSVKDLKVNEKTVFLHSLQGEYENQLLKKTFQNNEVKIGRNPKCQIQLKNQQVSSEHACLF